MKKAKYIIIMIIFILLPLLSTIIYDQFYLNKVSYIDLDDTSPTSLQGLQLILDIRTYSNPILTGNMNMTIDKFDNSKQNIIANELEQMCHLKIFSSYQKMIINELLSTNEYTCYNVNETPFEIFYFQYKSDYMSLKIDWNINKIIGFNISAYKPLTSNHYLSYLEYLQLDTIDDFTEIKDEEIYYLSRNTQLIIRPYVETQNNFINDLERSEDTESIGLEIINYGN